MINELSTDKAKSDLGYWGIINKTYTIDPVSGSYAYTADYIAVDKNREAGIAVTNNFIIMPDFYKSAFPLLYEFADKYKGTGYSQPLLPATDANTKYSADLFKLSMQAYNDIITGAKPISHFDDFVKTFYANGGTELEAEVNALLEQ